MTAHLSELYWPPDVLGGSNQAALKSFGSLHLPDQSNIFAIWMNKRLFCWTWLTNVHSVTLVCIVFPFDGGKCHKMYAESFIWGCYFNQRNQRVRDTSLSD